MDNLLIDLDMDQIGTLDEVSFEGPAVTVGLSFSISLWFWTNERGGKRVLVNQGNRQPPQPGWSLFFCDQELHFRVCSHGSSPLTVRVPFEKDEEWHHFLGVVDSQQGLQSCYLDGRLVAVRQFQTGQTSSTVLVADEPILIGGYTDRAGGHFDHTFGRNRSGLIDDFRIYDRSLSADEAAAFVDDGNLPPSAEFVVVRPQGEAPLSVTFDAHGSQDPDGEIRHYLWDFGDGQYGSGVRATHVYEYGGLFHVRLSVIDEDHAMSEKVASFYIEGRQNPLRFRPVFKNGDEGHACYRIPAIIRLQNGHLLAFAEARLQSCSDSTRTVRLVAKRSRDDGETWGDFQIVARNFVNDDEFAIQNISPVVDRVYGTGRIVLVYNKLEYNEWEIAGGKGISRVCCLHSDDHGFTWSEEKDIKMEVHRPYNLDYQAVYPDAARPENQRADWRIQRPTLGHAVQLDVLPVTRGRLFYSGLLTCGSDDVFDSYSYVFWSDDLGESWHIGGIHEGRRVDGSSAQGLNESTAVELESGNILINSRNYQNRRPVGLRAVTIVSFDDRGEATFDRTYHDESLVCPTVQASIMRHTYRHQPEYGARSRVLFSGPGHPRARSNLQVRLSYDECLTWPVSKVIDIGPAAYSDLVILDAMCVGVLFERGNQGGIWFVDFSLEWLTDGRDSLKSVE
jgi:sialidase-1